MEENILLQEYFKIYLVFIPAKNTLDISVALLQLNCGNLME